MTIPLVGLVLIGIYIFIGPALIIINQYILKTLHFPYPMFLSGLGVLFSGVFAKLLVRFQFVKLERLEAIEGSLWYRRVLPVGLSFAATLTFGNMVYLYLDVGFIQMLKSFTPVMIMITGYIAKVDIPTVPVWVSVLVITVGTIFTCSFTPTLNILGIFIMFLSETAEAIRLIMTQFFLQHLKFGIIESQYVLAPACAFWLFLASLCFEFPKMASSGGFDIILSNPAPFLVAGLTGIGVNFISYFVIQYTSSLSMKILGTIRNVIMVFVGVLFYNEVISTSEALGYSISLAGFIAYNLAKMGYFDGGHKPHEKEKEKEKDNIINLPKDTVDEKDLEMLLASASND
jgi:drug/metabolite transporter (DMT)-like permease